jgi:hypothetical protein
MNKNIEVINNSLWAVRFSYVPQIAELGYTGDLNGLEAAAAFTDDGKLVLNKQHEIYPTLKAMMLRIMPNSDQELAAKVDVIQSKEHDSYDRFYMFVLNTEIKRRTIAAKCHGGFNSRIQEVLNFILGKDG